MIPQLKKNTWPVMPQNCQGHLKQGKSEKLLQYRVSQSDMILIVILYPGWEPQTERAHLVKIM